MWDDNFFACPKWENLFDQLVASNKPFQFRQGLDVRLLTEQKAKRLSRSKYRGDILFAFDHIEDKPIIEEKLKLWRKFSSKGTRVYVLCAYDSQDEIDIQSTLERITILMKYGCLPYIMRYENYKTSKWKSLYTQLARWCNQPQFFKKKSFRQFCEANQAYTKSERSCSSMRSLTEFESAFPDIGKQYFDLRYEEENIFLKSSGYEYSFENCTLCTMTQETWDDILKNISVTSLIKKFILGDLLLECLSPRSGNCVSSEIDAAAKVSEYLLDQSLDLLVGIINERDSYDAISASNIPQFSKLSDATISVPAILLEHTYGLSFSEMGHFLDKENKKNDVAHKKYGENHVKLAAQLGLCRLIKETNNSWAAYPSELGRLSQSLRVDRRNQLVARLLFRIPLIRALIKDSLEGPIFVDDYLFSLAESTAKRRKSNIFSLLKIILESSGDDSSTASAIRRIR